MTCRRLLLVVFGLILSLPCLAATDDPYRVFWEEPVVTVNDAWVPGSFIISPDGSRFTYIVTSGKLQRVVLDGKEHKAYQSVTNLCFSPDSYHLAYFANYDNQNFLVWDGKESKPYDSVVAASFTFSPDGKHYAFVAKTGNKWLVVTETGESKAYDEINSSLLKFSPDSQRLAFAARVGEKWLTVLNGQESITYDGIRALTFSPDSQKTAVLVRSENLYAVMVDNEMGPAFPLIKAASLTFSPDNKQVAYVAGDQGREFVVLNHQIGKAYDQIISDQVSFSPDGSRIAFAAQLQEDQFVVVDGSEGKPYSAVMKSPPVFSPDGRKLAYTAFSGSQWMVVADGVEQPGYSNIGEGSLLFNKQGSRLAYTAKTNDGLWTVVVDGYSGRYYNDIGQGSLIFSPDGQNVVYYARLGSKWLVILDGKEGRPFDAIVTGLNGRINFNGPAFFNYWALDGKRLVSIRERIPAKSDFREFKPETANQPQSVDQVIPVIPKKEFIFKFNPPNGVVFIEQTKITDLLEAELTTQERRVEEIKIRAEVNKTVSGYEMNYQILAYQVKDQDDPEGGAALAVLEGVRFSSKLDSNGNLIGFVGLEEFDKKLKTLPAALYRKHKGFYAKEAIEARMRNNWHSTVESFSGKSFQLGDVWSMTTQIPLPNGELTDVGAKMSFKETVALGDHEGIRILSNFDFNTNSFKQFVSDMFKKGLPQLQSEPEVTMNGNGETIIDPETMLNYSSNLVITLKAVLNMPSIGKKEVAYKRIMEVGYDYQK